MTADGGEMVLSRLKRPHFCDRCSPAFPQKT
jgi:hypothetical protein